MELLNLVYEYTHVNTVERHRSAHAHGSAHPPFCQNKAALVQFILQAHGSAHTPFSAFSQLNAHGRNDGALR